MIVEWDVLSAKTSMVLIATAMLAACGGDGSSSGQVTVPNVVNDTQAAASTAITGAGLTVGLVTTQSSSTVAAGEVISEDPVAGTSVNGGTAVGLFISSGPATHTIGGTVIGLGPSATVHVLNGSDDMPVSANGSFTLPTGVDSGATYSVTVGTPTTPQTCAVLNGSGTVSADITNVVVYCTYVVTAATLNGGYTSVLALFDDLEGNTIVPVDSAGVTTFNGSGAYSDTGTINNGGLVVPGFTLSGTYAVATTDAIPVLTNDAGASGGIQGMNGNAFLWVGLTSGTAPGFSVGVVPNAGATTASIDGDYTLADLTAQVSTGTVYGYEATITLTNGVISGSYVQNSNGAITTGNPASGQWSVTNGALTSVGSATGAVSADGDLIVLADTNSGDDPYVNVAVRRGSGVTQATFEGVYSGAEYGGSATNSTFAKAITLFAYGNGKFSVTFTKNGNGTITTNNTGTGTYTLATDGTATLTLADGEIYNGAVSADGNALVLSSVASQQNPALFVGVRQ
jgi:hypothetical protein